MDSIRTLAHSAGVSAPNQNLPIFYLQALHLVFIWHGCSPISYEVINGIFSAFRV